MKLAILLQCHKNPEQIAALLNQLYHSDIDVYIHVDKKSNIQKDIKTNNTNAIFLPDSLRKDVVWGHHSQVDATLNLLKYSFQKKDYDYYCLISGQDFPIVSCDDILTFLSQNTNTNYVSVYNTRNISGTYTNLDKRVDIFFPEWLLKLDFAHRVLRRLWVFISGGYHRTFKIFTRKDNRCYKYYFGSQWWCINKDFAKYIINYLETDENFLLKYYGSTCPDESFFQTLIMNSDFADTRKDYLHYIDWSNGGNNPKILTNEDFEKIIKSNKLFARKFDFDVDKTIVDKIKTYILRNGI